MTSMPVTADEINMATFGSEHGRISFISFALGVSTLLFPSLCSLFGVFQNVHVAVVVIFGLFHAFAVSGFIYHRYHGADFQVAVRALFLGLVFSGSILWGQRAPDGWRYFAWYLTALSFFHWSEYFTTAVTNPKNLSLDSYLLDHSREYHIAALLSCFEFTIENYFFPGMKTSHWPARLGLLMIIGGELVRKGAMVTASTNFNHYIQRTRDENHELVTWGIYSYVRHPSYVGWFYWSIGTQVMLCNPLCMVGYAWASWRFFKARIEDEEVMLITFFGKNYIDYQKAVPTGLPFIEGYNLDL